MTSTRSTTRAMPRMTGQTGMNASLRCWLRSARAGLGMCSISIACPRSAMVNPAELASATAHVGLSAVADHPERLGVCHPERSALVAQALPDEVLDVTV